jgi:hypothetical protein
MPPPPFSLNSSIDLNYRTFHIACFKTEPLSHEIVEKDHEDLTQFSFSILPASPIVVFIGPFACRHDSGPQQCIRLYAHTRGVSSPT